MIITNCEFGPDVKESTTSNATLQQTHLSSQIDHFNPRTQTHNRSREISTKNVSQISSNGYSSSDGVTDNGNYINTSFGNFDASRRRRHLKLTNKSIVLADHRQSKKRNTDFNNEFPGFWTVKKKCRFEMEHEITNSPPLMEPECNMDVDDVEYNKGAHSPAVNTKSLDKRVSGNSTLRHTDPNASKSIQEVKNSKKFAICKDKIKESESCIIFLEEMFSNTHGSGSYYLQNNNNKNIIDDNCI